MKTKFNFRGTRKQIVLGLSMAMVTMVIIMVGCSKDGDLLNTATQNDNAKQINAGIVHYQERIF